MATIKVYVWERHGSFVGHSSMELSDGTYISFWPRDTVSVTNPVSPPFHRTNVNEDTSNEGGVSPKVFVIQTDTATLTKIKAWWSGHKDSTYNFISNNCSTIVFLGLKAGFSYLSCLDGELAAWVPIAVAKLAQGMTESGQAFFTAENVKVIRDVAGKETVALAKNALGKKGGK